MHVESFPPIESDMSRVLILGTMPGRVSLRDGQYYAHPQNLFWRIVGELVGFDPGCPYEFRVDRVRSAGIAIWDVLKTCFRASSLDSAIEASSVVPNDLPGFLAGHPHIRRVCFNGAKAELLYTRHVRPHLTGQPQLHYLRLPSTSPANASVPRAEKLRAWQAILS